MTLAESRATIVRDGILEPFAEEHYPMHMAPTLHRWSRSDLARLPDDGNRYEILDGQLLVTPLPSPLHQRIAFRLMYRLEPYVHQHGLGTVLGPGAVIFGRNELQPDVAVLPVPPRRLPRAWTRAPRPSLVVEILSPTTRLRDLSLKRHGYQRVRIPDYWVIDPEDRVAQCWQPSARESRVESVALHWHPVPKQAPLVIELDDILEG